MPLITCFPPLSVFIIPYTLPPRTKTIIFVNHSAHDHHLGTINGIAQTVAAAARSIGPALGGALWSLSVKMHFLSINFIASMLIFLCMHLISYMLPTSIDSAKQKTISSLGSEDIDPSNSAIESVQQRQGD
jgi:hypothetical protein